VALAALLLAGCGGGDDTAASTTTDGLSLAAKGAELLEVRISTDEYMLSPAYVTLAFPGIYLFRVTNEGRRPHALAIARGNVTLRTPTLAPGATATLKVKLEEQGEYELYSRVDGDRARGMKGTLTLGN
jgi:plastocyanin